MFPGELTQRWCILRTSPARTLSLARSLRSSGLDAWSPRQIIFRRRPRSNQTDELEVPIAPTFVFVRAAHLPDIMAALAPGRINPHPPFGVFRFDGRTPLVADHEIGGMQAEEEAKTEETRLRRHALDAERRRADDKRRKAVRKERRRAGRRAPIDLQEGMRVSVQDSSWSGMSGVVTSTDGSTARVSFGGMMGVTVDAWLLLPDMIRAA